MRHKHSRDAHSSPLDECERTRVHDLVGDVRTHATIISAYVQILRRRIHREANLEPRDLLDHLTVIERSTQRLESRLRAAEHQTLRRACQG